MPLTRINPGEAITAAFLNALVDAVNALGGDAAGTGGTGSGGRDDRSVLDSSVAAMLSTLAPDIFIPARIIDVNGNEAGLNVPSVPSTVRYGVVGIRSAGIALVNKTPRYGRPVRNDEAKIWPAIPGMACVIVRVPSGDGAYTGDLMLLPGSEVVARRRCAGLSRSAAVEAGLPPLPLKRPEEDPPLPEIPAFGPRSNRSTARGADTQASESTGGPAASESGGGGLGG